MRFNQRVGIGPRVASMVGGQIWLFDWLTVYEKLALVVDPYGLAGQANNALDERLGRIIRKPEHNYVAALDWVKVIDELVYEYPLVVLEPREHRRPFNLDRLNDKHDYQDGGDSGKDYISR